MDLCFGEHHPRAGANNLSGFLLAKPFEVGCSSRRVAINDSPPPEEQPDADDDDTFYLGSGTDEDEDFLKCPEYEMIRYFIARYRMRPCQEQ